MRRDAFPALALVLLVAVGSARLSAATAGWSGAAGDGRWGNAANWSPAPPAVGDTVVLPAGARVAREPADVGCAELVAEGDAEITGAPLASGVVRCTKGTLTLGCGLALAGDAALDAATGATITVSGASDLGDHRLSCRGEGRAVLLGALVGAGGIDCRGPGRVDFAGAAKAYRGATALLGGEAWILSDVEPDRDGALGNGHEPVLIDGGCLVDGAERIARALLIGQHGGRIDAVGKARTIAADIATGDWAGGGLIGTFLNRSMRDTTVDDWRKRPEVTGEREDARIHFPQSAYGTHEERARFRIAGGDNDWDAFSVQWDGWLRIERDGVTLSTCSDDGSRVWIDLDHDGAVSAGEWGLNGWGGGQGATTRPVSGPLKAGVYQFRLQCEDGGGPNCISLLWDDAQHSGGAYAGLQVVPAADYLRAPSLSIGGDDYGEERGKPLTLGGAITGGGAVSKLGASEATLAGHGVWTGGTRVESGTLIIGAAEALPPSGGVQVGPRGRVIVRAATRIGAPRGAGEIELAAPLTATHDGDAEFSGALSGAATLTKLGKGRLTLAGPVGCPVEAREGSVAFADGRLITGLALVAPLTTAIELPRSKPGPREALVTVEVPTDAPADLGCGVCVGDQHGHWFQCFAGERLTPGRHELRVDLGERACLRSEPWCERWDAAAAATATRTKIFFWSASASRAKLRIDARVMPAPPSGSTAARLLEVAPPRGALLTGQRLEWTCRPEPFPTNPYDADEFTLDAVLIAPDGAETRVPGFYGQRMASRDRGDREEVTPAGGGRFAARFRARVPGEWKARLEARWRGGRAVAYALPPFTVAGEPWDGYVHVDKQDPRFMAVGGDFYWPIGLNIHSVCDPRDRDCLGTRMTPDRGALAYAAYLDRFAAAGGSAAEIWLAPWVLGLEWRGDWNGFHGVGRYSQENADRLDRVLDLAWGRGIRVNLVITNHGQASEGADPEWANSPYNSANGGWLPHPAEWFTDARALRAQEDYRRYLVARYADHPAILGWKLFSEVNLTAAGANVVAWHEQACARWHALDAYGHPTTSHWAGDWNSPDRRVVALPGLDYVCIDQYHQGGLLADLLAIGADPKRGLGMYKKPILITEFGGNWNAGPAPLIVAEQAYAPWATFVSGYCASPMLWWYEFVDQRGLWAPYGAIARFVAGEDLRGADASSAPANAASGAGALWCRVWKRPGRLLGYVLDREWGEHGGEGRAHDQARIDLGVVAAGDMTVEWWDADAGKPLGRDALAADGQAPLVLSPPAFHRHLGFKLWRTGAQASVK